MSKNFAITSYDYSLGCTFIDWSVHFLSGKYQYYSLNLCQWVPLTDNPLNTFNAHNHARNHPSGIVETTNYIHQMQKVDQLVSIYPCPPRIRIVTDQLGLSKDHLRDSNVTKNILAQRNDEFIIQLDYCATHLDHLIVVGYYDDFWNSLYHYTLRSADRFTFSDERPQSLNDIFNENQEIYFANSIEHWKNLNLNNIWDQRERIALDLRLTKHLTATQPQNISRPHYWIHAANFWTSGHLKILEIIDYLGLKIENKRLTHWQHVFKQWQQIQFDNLLFSQTCKHIVESIVNNSYYNMPELTFNQECIILHLLMYKHDLNLRSWRLEKFPKNTKDLHKLLESNIHQLHDKSYIELLSQFY